MLRSERDDPADLAFVVEQDFGFGKIEVDRASLLPSLISMSVSSCIVSSMSLTCE